VAQDGWHWSQFFVTVLSIVPDGHAQSEDIILAGTDTGQESHEVVLEQVKHAVSQVIQVPETKDLPPAQETHSPVQSQVAQSELQNCEHVVGLVVQVAQIDGSQGLHSILFYKIGPTLPQYPG